MTQRIARGLILMLGIALVCQVACNNNKPGESKDTLGEIERTHEVKVAVHPYNIPFEFGMGTSVQGIGADVGDEIAKTLKARLNWAKTESFEQIFTLLEKGEVHMAISSISITDERKQRGFLFSHSYYPDSGQIIVAKTAKTNDKSIKNLAGLSNKKVGVEEGTTGQKYLESQNIPGVQIEKFRTHDDALLKLSSGEIDAFIGDKPIVSYIIYKNYQDRLHMVGDLLTHEPYAVMTKDPKLLKIIDETIDRMDKEGKLKQIAKSRFDEVDAEIIRRERVKEAKEQEKKKPKTVTFRITSSRFPLDRLDGHQIHMSGEGRSFTSSHITSSGKTASCSVGNVPPGKYQASLGVIKLVTTVEVVGDGSSSMTVNLNL